MRLRDDPRRLLIRNTPSRYWLAGGLLMAAGLLCLAAALGLWGDPAAPPTGPHGKAVAFGGVVAAIGAWLCWHAPLSMVVVDHATQILTLTRRSLLRRSTDHYPGATIANVRVTKERDSKGKPVYRVELVLHTGAAVSIPLVRPHDRNGCMRAAERLWAALGLSGRDGGGRAA